MKSQLAGLMMSLLLVGVAVAEPPMAPPGFDIDRLTILLDLSDAQKAAVQQVLADERKTLQADREQARASGVRPTREEMRAKHEAVHQELRAKLQSVLTPAQLTKFDALMAPPAKRQAAE